MIKLKPESYTDFNCPECYNRDLEIKDVLFPGIHILADCVCMKCGLKFLVDFPIGHSLYYPTVIGKENNKDYSNPSYNWFHKSLLESYKNKNNISIKIERKIINETKEVIILNCLDYLYGHVLLKLFNAQFYLEQFPCQGLVVIVPKNFEWLVPDAISEVWVVDIKISEARQWFNSIHSFVKDQLKRFDKVYLSLANPQPDISKIDISKFTKVKRFHLEEYEKKPFSVCFVHREDRFWFRSKFEEYIFNFLLKIKMVDFAKLVFLIKQNKKVSKTLGKIKNEIPAAKVYVVGMGRRGEFSSNIIDLREDNISEEVEIKWCKLFAESHLVIGVHGSNMILPTALAAGFIEILPENRYGNITQDIAMVYEGPLYHYLCRYVDEYISPRKLARLSVCVLSGFKNFYLRSNHALNLHKVFKDSSDLKSYFNNESVK